MSEGGIGWVAMLLDRLDNIVDRSGYGLGWDIRPAEVLKRNFWFCTIDDPSTIDTRYRIGVENIMVEVDYPHGDSTWPDTQSVIEKCWGHLPPDELRAMCSENAAALYRHPLPEPVLPTLTGAPMDFTPDRRQADPRPVTPRGAGGAGPGPVARGLQRSPRRPHHRQPGRRDAAVQSVAAHLGRASAVTGHADRPRGRVLEGDWPVPLGIPLHLEMHKLRADVKWAVHNHPLYGTVWADMGEIPPILDQSSALGGGRLALVNEYDGPVNDPASARRAVEQMGDAAGPAGRPRGLRPRRFGAGRAPEGGRSRAAVPARLARPGRRLHGRVAAPGSFLDFMARTDGEGFIGFWEAAVRAELRADPHLLDVFFFFFFFF